MRVFPFPTSYNNRKVERDENSLPSRAKSP